MSQRKDLQSLIKAQVIKAKNLFTEKDIIENEIKETFNAIKEAMNDEIHFIFENEADRYGDSVSTVYVSTPKINRKHTVITYDFDNKTIFPIKITDIYDLPCLCNNLDEVKKFLERMISDDNFMIRLVAISKEEDNINYGIDDDIPF